MYSRVIIKNATIVLLHDIMVTCLLIFFVVSISFAFNLGFFLSGLDETVLPLCLYVEVDVI